MRLALFLLLLTGCARNPVTGQNELHFISEDKEIAMGTEIYPILQQVEGGPYLVDPKVQGYIEHVGERLVRVCDRPSLPYEFIVLDNSIPNAWSLPGGKIGINRGLLDKLQSEAELAAVLSHEIVHSAARHSAQAMQRGMLLEGGLAALGYILSGNSYEDIVMGTANVSAGLVATKYSRGAESEADHYGMKYMAAAGYDPEAAVDLQRTFLKLHEGHEPNWLDGLFASHPPTEDRVAANQETAAQLPKGGEMGKEEYSDVMATLLEDIPAYDALDEGYKRLILSSDARGALALAEQGLKQEPDEGHLHNLKGKAERALGRPQEALASFVKASELNNRYFDFLLQRGLMEYELDDYSSARPDLEQSVSLLPTAEGHYALGKIAMSEGRMGDALNHFRMAQQSPEGIGDHSQVVKASPFEGIVDAKVTISRADRSITFHILNRSKLLIHHITVELTFYTEKQKVISSDKLTIPVKVGPGNRVSHNTGLTAPSGTAYAQAVVLDAST